MYKRLTYCLSISIYFLYLINLSSKEINIGKIIAYPNPYSPNTSNQPLTFRRSEGGKLMGFAGEIKIIVYNASLYKIYERDYPSIGGEALNTNIFWSGVDSRGNRVSSGLYYARVSENRMDGSTGFTFVKIIVR